MRDGEPEAGLFGPGSVSWQVLREASVMIGGVRALLMHAAHPLVVAGARQTGMYERDPWRRLARTLRQTFTVVFGTSEEAAAASGVEIRDAATLREAGGRLLDRWEAGAVLISRGEEGMALFKPGAHGVIVEEFPTVAREVFDVTGAGDTVLATCALALGAGGTLEEATVLANHAAGVVVGKIGTATVAADELARDVRRG